MTYRNDPYDPKQVALLAQAALDDAVAAARARRSPRPPTWTRSPRCKPQHLGDRPPVSLARREIGSLPPAAKADAGKRVNEARAAVQAAYDARLAALDRGAASSGCSSRRRSTSRCRPTGARAAPGTR